MEKHRRTHSDGTVSLGFIAPKSNSVPLRISVLVRSNPSSVNELAMKAFSAGWCASVIEHAVNITVDTVTKSRQQSFEAVKHEIAI